MCITYSVLPCKLQSHLQLQDAIDVGLATQALVHKVPLNISVFISIFMSKHILWTSACIAKPTSSASCSS